ncbi:MAG: exosortase K [Steroidobacteraceae bacterium]
MVEWRQRRRAALAWCALAGAAAVALKYHFSVAAASDLQWMLHPLALLLRAATGCTFERNTDGAWQSLGAGLVLIKACAGINFMVLSFLGWCWTWRPRARTWPLWQWPLRLGGALGCAWLLSLGVNALRILMIVRFQPSLEYWLAPADAHRLLGLMTYLPALCLQGLLADREEPALAVLLGCGLYALLMLGLPLASGSAAADPRLYAAHAAEALAVLIPLLGIAGWRHNCRARRFRGS